MVCVEMSRAVLEKRKGVVRPGMERYVRISVDS
jgi:hypothetical protein